MLSQHSHCTDLGSHLTFLSDGRPWRVWRTARVNLGSTILWDAAEILHRRLGLGHETLRLVKPQELGASDGQRPQSLFPEVVVVSPFSTGHVGSIPARMAVLWRESQKGFGPVVVLTDQYTVKELSAAFDGICRHWAAPGRLHMVLDFRPCSPPTWHFMIGALNTLQIEMARRPGGRIAMVVASEAAYGMGRLAEATTEVRRLPFTWRTFREWEAAEGWIVDKEDTQR